MRDDFRLRRWIGTYMMEMIKITFIRLKSQYLIRCKQRKRRFENLQFVGNGFYCEIRNRNFRKSIDKAVEMC